MNTKPILFNTDMVRAILASRKTVTRRIIKDPWYIDDEKLSRVSGLAIHRGTNATDGMPYPDQPYSPGDILYVRETWERSMAGTYLYKATDTPLIHDGWRPSIHMPREAARIFLRVTDVRVERLQDINERGPVSAEREGFFNDVNLMEGTGKSATKHFSELWDSTIKTSDRALYSWDANPWVWVIEFERISRKEALA